MEKGFFGIFDNMVFRLDEPSDIAVTVNDIMNEVQQRFDGDHLHLGINISNVKEDVSTNHETYKRAVNIIRKTHAENISTLLGTYRISLDYQLHDVKNRRVLDEGILTRTLDGVNAMLPLGLDADTNEMVHRIVKTLSHTFTIRFKEDLPYGIMQEKSTEWALYINNIKVEQLIAVEKEVIKPKEKPHKPNPTSLTRTPFLEGWKNINKNEKITYTSKGEWYTIYSTHEENMVFNPILIRLSVRKIEFNINILLNNYFLTADVNDIEKFVKENYHHVVEGWVPPHFDEEDHHHHGNHHYHHGGHHHHGNHHYHHGGHHHHDDKNHDHPHIPTHDCGRPHKEDCLMHGFKSTEKSFKIKQIPDKYYPVIFVPQPNAATIAVYESKTKDLIGMLYKNIEGEAKLMEQIYRNIMIDIMDHQMPEVRFTPSKRVNLVFDHRDFDKKTKDFIIAESVKAINNIIANNTEIGEMAKIIIKKTINLAEAEFPIVIPDKADVTIRLEEDGEIVASGSYNIQVEPGGKLLLKGNGKVTSSDILTTAIINVDGGKFILDGPSIIANSISGTGNKYGIYVQNDGEIRVVHGLIQVEYSSCISTNNLTGHGKITIDHARLISKAYAIYIANQSLVTINGGLITGINARMGQFIIGGNTTVVSGIAKEDRDPVGKHINTSGCIWFGEPIAFPVGTYDDPSGTSVYLKVSDEAVIDGGDLPAIGVYLIDTKEPTKVDLHIKPQSLKTSSIFSAPLTIYDHEDIKTDAEKYNTEYTPAETSTVVNIYSDKDE